MKVLFAIALVVLILATSLQAGILTRNAATPSENTQRLAEWLGDIGITLGQVEFLEDFETGFINQQNISGVTGLFPGGLVITDTSSAHTAKILSGSGVINGSNPVDTYALTQNEVAYLELDFSVRPVDYVSFQDIDHTGTNVIVHFLGGGTASTSFETTGATGNTAEFFGIFRNDMPLITRIQLDATGDGRWGIDNIRYGLVPEPSGILALLTGIGALGMIVRRKR